MLNKNLECFDDSLYFEHHIDAEGDKARDSWADKDDFGSLSRNSRFSAHNWHRDNGARIELRKLHKKKVIRSYMGG